MPRTWEDCHPKSRWCLLADKGNPSFYRFVLYWPGKRGVVREASGTGYTIDEAMRACATDYRVKTMREEAA